MTAQQQPAPRRHYAPAYVGPDGDLRVIGQETAWLPGARAETRRLNDEGQPGDAEVFVAYRDVPNWQRLSDEQDHLHSWRADLDGGVLEGFQEGLSETADEFFRDRAGWLVPPYGVRVVDGLTGGFDVAVCVDGTYADRAGAEQSAAYVQAIIAGHLDRINAGESGGGPRDD